MESITLKAVDSTYILSYSPNTNYNDSNNLEVENSNIGQAISYVKFPFGNLPKNIIIKEANLNMYLWYESDNNVVNNLKIGNVGLPDDFNEQTATWNNVPEWSKSYSTAVTTKPIRGVGWKSLNITNMIPYLRGRNDRVILYNEYNDSKNAKTFYSFNNNQKPFLTINYEPVQTLDLSFNINGTLRKYDKGYTIINGSLKEIEKAWVCINGSLKEI